MQRSCDSCGKRYEAKRKASRYCSDTCRKRAQRAPQLIQPGVSAATTNLAAVTERQLVAADRLDTILGQQALILAGKIDSPHETASGAAALSKEFRAVMEEAMEGVNAVANPLDELRVRRERKSHSG